jgi:PAS domain S-box-containing protein
MIGGAGFHGELDLLRASIEAMVGLLDARYAEIRQTARELQENREFLDKIVENIPNMIFLKDAVDLRFVKFNRAGEELLGYSREELLGRSDDDFFPKEEADFFKRKDREVLSSGQLIDIPEETIQTRYRGERILHTQKIPLSDREGKPQYLLGISEDITDRRREEEQKRSLEERLQRAEKMEALGTLAGGVAHDLNNVLGIVVGYAELLLADMDESGPLRPALLNILDGGERAAAIVQDLLTLARRGVPGRKILNLNRIVTDSLDRPESVKLLSLHPAVRVVMDLEPDLLNLAGSPVHLGKSLFNLLSNGCEAMPHGGVVTVRTANRYIDRPVQGYDEIREGDYVVLTVTDTGTGIPAEDLPRIFEPFYTKKVMGRSGTGLGLAVVWGTVKDHHGYIQVRSEEGRGSTFSLYFPVTREEPAEEQAALPASAYRGRGESILVVDDVKGQRDLAVAMLRKLNYAVTTVAGGEEALACLREHPVDLLILDMIMDPGMDGLDTYRGVLEIHPGQKAIIVSGFSETERVNEARALGAGAYVRKPYVLEKLGLAVRNELDRRAERAK